MFNTRFFILIVTCCVIILFTGEVFCNGLNAEITISEPEADYFEPGDTLTVTLILTDNDGNALRVDRYNNNGLRYIDLWVSGPRQNYLSVEPYVLYIILNLQNGFNDDAGFNPETGEMRIILPDDLESMGTYTVFFGCDRRVNNRNYNSYPIADFQVGQTRPTVTASYTYLTCNSPECHLNPSQHGFSDLTTCVICHTHDYDTPWNVIEHERRGHQESGVTDVCHNCHRVNAGINRISRQACFSCHEVCENVDEDVDNELCLDCHDHDNSDRWIYEGHNEPYPHTPDAFNLLEPAHNDWIEEPFVLLSWEASDDDDNNDSLTYQVELSLDPEFEDYQVYDVQNSTRFVVIDLQEDAYYLWRVKAIDLNTNGIYSNQTRRFQTAEPQPPSPFRLLFPMDGDTAVYREGYRLGVQWERSVDPDPESELEYEAYFHLTYDTQDSLLVYGGIVRDNLNFDLLDSMGMDHWESYVSIEWWVDAIAGDDTVRCETPFMHYITPNPSDAPELGINLPTDYSVSAVYPNPFNSNVNIVVGLPIPSNLDVSIYSLSGQKTAQIAQGCFTVGIYKLQFQANDLPCGIYFIRWDISGEMKGTQKVLLLK